MLCVGTRGFGCVFPVTCFQCFVSFTPLPCHLRLLVSPVVLIICSLFKVLDFIVLCSFIWCYQSVTCVKICHCLNNLVSTLFSVVNCYLYFHPQMPCYGLRKGAFLLLDKYNQHGPQSNNIKCAFKTYKIINGMRTACVQKPQLSFSRK